MSTPTTSRARVPIPRAQTSTPTPSRRRDSSLRSSVNPPIMVNSLSPLPPHHSNQATEDGEVFHRDHTLISFEWQIQGLDWLRRSLEEVPISGWTVDYEVENPEVLPELLRRGVVIGEGWYKLDMARTIPSPGNPTSSLEEVAAAITEASVSDPGSNPLPTSLSLYITSPTLESAPLDYSFTSAIFVGIRPAQPDVGQRLSYTRWIWHTSVEHEFTKDSEYVAITLPPLEELLDMSPIREDNGFALCVQLASPAHLKPGFTMPDQNTAPLSMIQGLRSLLDSTTGDVQFVCLEHGPGGSRKRVLYAHSEILRSRSDYFKSLLAGGFKEVERGGRITVDDADFDTVYWLLHFIYCNELRFAPVDNVRQVMNRLQLDKRQVKRLLAGHFPSGEWEYRAIPLEEDNMSSMSELDLSEAVSSASTSISRSPPPETKRIPSAMVSAVTSRRLSSKPSSPPPLPRGHLPFRLTQPDPHIHPTAVPAPASPLAIYMLAHRYGLEVLEDLAKERILKGLTVDNCMPMLFATNAYDSLHIDILDFVVDYFGSVQLSTEFQVCIKEVSAGAWGETGGDVLMSLFKRL